MAEVDSGAARSGDVWCLAEVEIFSDLTEAEKGEIAANVPKRSYRAGDLLFSPPGPGETLFILKQGRVRVFRVSPEGRALTTAIMVPGTMFGEMPPLGQQMYDSFAEALDDVAVCLMDREDVHTLLLSDARIAARIAESLGTRVAQLERRLSDAVFKTVPQRIAATLCLLADDQPGRPLGRGVQLTLTHEQIAALTGTSRETATKVLGEYADRGLLRLGRGRLTILDVEGVAAEAGE